MLAPFPYFGGKRSVTADVWRRLGCPSQYIEPFCGSAAMLLAAPRPAALEVICDGSGFIANFWRAVKHHPGAVAQAADYPVSHIDLGAAHIWLMAQRERIGAGLQDIEWPGDAKAAGRWLWGQCCWIGSGWCEWTGKPPNGMGKIPNFNAGFGGGVGINACGQVPQAGNAGKGIQAIGQVPHASDAGKGIHAIGQMPHASDAGMGVQAIGKVPHFGGWSGDGMGIQAPGAAALSANAPVQLWTSGGRTAWRWLHQLADRLERVRVVHGDWSRCLNNHFGGSDTALFLDPPYRSYERVYDAAVPVADAVEAWARKNAHLRIALCGHVGDYDLPEWDAVNWSRGKFTYAGSKTTDAECVWYSPACLPREQPDLFAVPVPVPPEDARCMDLFREPEVSE